MTAAAAGFAFVVVFWVAFRIWLRIYRTDRFDWIRDLANGRPKVRALADART